MPRVCRLATKTHLVTVEATSSIQTQRREAERLPVAADGFFGETLVHVVELSLVGCRVIHLDRVAIGAAGVVRVTIGGVEIRAAARVVRSKFEHRDGATFYESGLQFCASLRGAPHDVERALTALLAEQMPLPQTNAAKDADFEYVLCVRSSRGWRAIPTHDPHQPREGFTMPLPHDETEISVTCRTYDVADLETRRMMRLAFELTIAAALLS